MKRKAVSLLLMSSGMAIPIWCHHTERVTMESVVIAKTGLSRLLEAATANKVTVEPAL